ncbi:MAG: ASKHA domain-containing protein [Clostridiaceae bacterium]|nr:ASKHA domain-containing protein [Clostridiaceae bacterium]
MELRINDGQNVTKIEYTAPALLSTLFSAHNTGCDMPCGGKRRCLQCKVRVTGNAIPPDTHEAALLSGDERASGIRYACMTTLTGNAEVTLLHRGEMRIQTEGATRPVSPEPWASGFGIAIDIGTTTVAGYLYELATGKGYASASLANPQGRFGADVVTRIERALGEDAAALALAIRDGANELIMQLCRKAKLDLRQIGAVVFTGNTTMLYLLTERNPYALSRSPFEADELFGEYCTPEALGLRVSDAKIYLMRSISAFVGGDITAGILSTALCEGDRPCLLVDIGTNGEMALWDGKRLLCCATAAGPAFEGAGISRGMTAQDGAISKVSVEGKRIVTQTVGDAKAVGICGSGLLDAVAAFLQLGLIDETGYIDEDADTEGYITEDGDLRIGATDVLFTQKDVRAVQLAKSAICSGMETLMETAGLTADSLGAVYLAGGFGTVLNPASAEAIGLLPRGYAAKTVAVGNAAGMGAAAVLRNRSLLNYSEELAQEARTMPLAENPVFMEKFVENMMF